EDISAPFVVPPFEQAGDDQRRRRAECARGVGGAGEVAVADEGVRRASLEFAGDGVAPLGPAEVARELAELLAQQEPPLRFPSRNETGDGLALGRDDGRERRGAEHADVVAAPGEPLRERDLWQHRPAALPEREQKAAHACPASASSASTARSLPSSNQCDVLAAAARNDGSASITTTFSRISA